VPHVAKPMGAYLIFGGNMIGWIKGEKYKGILAAFQMGEE